MSKWEELNSIHTPEEWKDIKYCQKSKRHYSFSFVVVSLIIFISFVTVSAFHSDISQWLTKQFSKEDIHSVQNVSFKDLNVIEPPFGYIEYKDKIIDVYLIHNQNIQKMNPTNYKGMYKGKSFSFSYILYHSDIFMFNFQGPIEYGIDKIYKNTVYLCTKKRDIISLNLKTGKIRTLVKDHDSVNPILSPQGRYLLINKRDKYWTIYDTVTRIEKKVPDICGFALSNEVSFYDDNHIITYGGDYTIVIDSATQKVTQEWDTITQSASAFDFSNQVIKNYITGQSCEIRGKGEVEIVSRSNHYYLFEDEEQNYYLYSIDKNKYVPLSIPIHIKKNVNLSLYEYEDDHELMIYTDEENYFVNLNSLFQ